MAFSSIMPQVIRTPVTDLLGISHPVILAGMNKAASADLAAAVSNAGGLGVVGGVTMTPNMLRTLIKDLKSGLHDPMLPFGVDLLLPKIGDGARSTNYDYTHGQLAELIDVIIEEGSKLFVCAVGVPPVWVVKKLHDHRIPVMNMIGSPKHVKGALDAGADLICAQGGEGGGHTGDVATSILVPAVVDIVQGKVSPLFGTQVQVVAAGGIVDGRGLASSLAYGAGAAWVGTRFVASAESGAPKFHKDAIVNAGFHDTHRTLIFTGRPLRIIKTPYSVKWEEERQAEMKEALSKGIIPAHLDMFGLDLSKIPPGGVSTDTAKETHQEGALNIPGLKLKDWLGLLTGAACGSINDIKPAKEVLDSMVAQAADIIRRNQNFLVSKL
eukprot:TRINITY_DN7089_c0_g1_i1.p1 TRINITY_DN7089_c0_g1~~TRINITY_DN7089_c0_g1_i1.p1  ORF type:complete len:418 (+),score=59.38 TRINITY_DN7089_c0_g1_i1:106-1254(+)